MKKNLMKGILIALGVIMLVSIGNIVLAEEKKEAAPPSENIVVVNGQAVSRACFNWALSNSLTRVEKNGKKLDAKDLLSLKHQIVETIVNAVVLAQQAAKDGIKVDDAVVNTKCDERKKKQFPNDADYQTMLTKAVATDAAVKELCKMDLVVAAFEKKMSDAIKNTPEEIKEFYDKNPDKFKGKDGKVVAFDTAKVAIDALLKITKFQKDRDDFITKLRKETKLERFPM
ncbi:MAG: SurA N-terminal domain-containing protein [Desulfobacterales bacterium]|nr:SurA N-terminal domain-containing protein [Desulfobacterales bacterium]MBF0398884.1 SurA N-terminal domain-containing protein [Desulfobacterales bacterium]